MDLLSVSANIVVGLVSLGMALAFISADWRSPTSRAICICFGAVGLSILGNSLTVHLHQLPVVPAWTGWIGVFDGIAMLAGFEWILRIRRTVPSRNLRTAFGDNMLRVAQLCAVVYAVNSVLFPQERAHDFFNALIHPDALTQPGFYYFSIPLELGLTLAGISALMLLNRKPDVAERIRLIAFVIATPLIASGLVLPIEIAPITTVVGLLIFLCGAVHYHVHQGQRGQFLSSFLSPQVAEMVSRRGMEQAMQEDTMEISVVSCDLRGFTSFTETTASTEVIQILEDYYNTVGAIAADFGATIKDHAGDGILLLVGAPLPYPDHAERALKMAARIIDEGRQVLKRHQSAGRSLDIGAGVATGRVTVGVIGGAGRLEYAAVGPTVNLASRLCDTAAAGEVLVDRHTLQHIGEDHPMLQFSSRDPVTLKGFSKPIQSYALAAA